MSVFLPTYQQREFLRQALDSVIEQDYENIEIVVSDDASTDGTQELMREYDRRFPGKFKLLFVEKNTGITANCNRTLAACTGEFIAWFAGDDLWLPGKLHKQVAWFEQHPDAAICYTNAELFDSDTGQRIRLQHDAANPFREGGAEQMFKSGTFFNGCSVMARRSMVPNGYEPSLSIVSDWLFWVETARKGAIGYVDEVLTRYRVHRNNVTKRFDVFLRDQLAAIAIAESRFPEYSAYTRLMRADAVFGAAVEALKQDDMSTARRRFWESVRIRLRGPSYAPFPMNATIAVLAQVGLAKVLWRVWAWSRGR